MSPHDDLEFLLEQRLRRRRRLERVRRRRRAGVVLGREIPGFGVALAAGFNLRSTRGVGRSAIKLFEHLA
jgi:hypothetical protein